MREDKKSRPGFTLIEVIAALVLTGIAAVFAGMLLTTTTQIYLTARAGDEDSQKVQVAMNRLVKELSWAEADSVQAPDSQTLQWVSLHPEREGEGGQTASWEGTAGSALELNGVPLMDGVADFQASVSSGYVGLSLTSVRLSEVDHTTRIYLRLPAGANTETF